MRIISKTPLRISWDDNFVAGCHSIPGSVVECGTSDEVVADATQAYIEDCRTGVWN